MLHFQSLGHFPPAMLVGTLWVCEELPALRGTIPRSFCRVGGWPYARKKPRCDCGLLSWHREGQDKGHSAVTELAWDHRGHPEHAGVH